MSWQKERDKRQQGEAKQGWCFSILPLCFEHLFGRVKSVYMRPDSILTSLFDQFFSQSTKKNSFLVEAIEPASAFVYKKAFNQNRLVWKLYP